MSNNLKCYLELQITGIDHLLVYHVRPETWERLQSVLDENERLEDEFCFFSFDTEDGRTISLSVNDLEFIKYTMNPTVSADKGERKHRIQLYFRNRKEPVIGLVEDEDDAFYLEANIIGALKNDSFLTYVDNNGDRCSFNVEHLVLMELQTAQIVEGGESLEQQGADESSPEDLLFS